MDINSINEVRKLIAKEGFSGFIASKLIKLEIELANNISVVYLSHDGLEKKIVKEYCKANSLNITKQIHKDGYYSFTISKQITHTDNVYYADFMLNILKFSVDIAHKYLGFYWLHQQENPIKVFINYFDRIDRKVC